MFEEDEATVMVPTFGPGAFFADRYRIDELLGSGAMGRVYAATELHSSRRVALKILHRERMGEEETVQRFSREAEVLASIGHPCIVEVYAFHKSSDGIPYLAMELLEGVTLKTRLTNAGRFEDPQDFQRILDCIGGALGAAHARGVVHRDLKPDNVFLPATGDPRAKLVDFGLSRMALQSKNLTHSGMILGTPRYMAPEQIRNAAAAGPAVDIYSVGVVVYESLSGRSPYPGQDYGQLLGCVLEGRVVPLEKVRPDLPSALGDVIRRAMDPEPARRFARTSDLADAYAAAIGSPSHRPEIPLAARPRRTTSSGASHQALVANKGSTLAFDLSAASLGDLPDVHDVAPALAGVEQQGYGSVTDPDPFQLSGGDTAPLVEAVDASYPVKAQGGDTLFIPAMSGLPPPPAAGPSPVGPHALGPSAGAANPYGSPPTYGASSYASPMGAPYAQPAPAPKKKKGRGLLLFMIAMVVVILLSAAAGFGLRAYQRGELTSVFPPAAG